MFRTATRGARSRRRGAVALVAAVGLIVAACGSDDASDELDEAVDETPVDTAPEPETTDDADDESSSARDIRSVVLVANQDAGDQGPVDGMIAGLESSAETWGFETRFVGAPDPATHETTLRNLANSDADIIITTFFDLAGTVELVAPDFPDTIFLTIVSGPTEQPNVNSLVYELYKAAYVGGRFAGAMTETNRLAYIGGAPLPFAWADFNAFTDGAKDVNPDVETTAAFAPGGFTDAPGGRELAGSLFAAGNDFIFTGAAETDLGVVAAAAENDGMLMVSSDLVDRAPDNVAILVLIEWAMTVERELEHIVTGGELGRFRLANPESGEITFRVPDEFLDGASGDRPARAAAIIPDVEAAIEALIAGEIIVEEVGEER